MHFFELVVRTGEMKGRTDGQHQ